MQVEKNKKSSWNRFLALGLVLSLAFGLFLVPSARAHAEDEDTKGVAVEIETVTAEAPTFEFEAEIKEQLSSKLNLAAGKLYEGITFITLNDCGKRAAGFLGAFSNGYTEFKKAEDKKKASAASASKLSKDRVYSDVLTYSYNPDFVKDVTDEEYEILCRITEAEAGDQDVYGRILVVNVILNRVNYTKEFANTIEGVVFEKGQFSPITNGAYDRAVVDDLTREAVDRALEGEDYSQGALYFFMRSATSKSASAWFDSLEFILKYGCHEFFKG